MRVKAMERFPVDLWPERQAKFVILMFAEIFAGTYGVGFIQLL